jgi:hypothetical protein
MSAFHFYLSFIEFRDLLLSYTLLSIQLAIALVAVTAIRIVYCGAVSTLVSSLLLLFCRVCVSRVLLFVGLASHSFLTLVILRIIMDQFENFFDRAPRLV